MTAQHLSVSDTSCGSVVHEELDQGFEGSNLLQNAKQMED